MDTDAGNLDKTETEDAGVVSAGAFFAGLARGKRDCVSLEVVLVLHKKIISLTCLLLMVSIPIFLQKEYCYDSYQETSLSTDWTSYTHQGKGIPGGHYKHGHRELRIKAIFFSQRLD
jgi:hypothetical protein